VTFFDQIKTVVVVSFVTAVIWLYAEGAVVKEYEPRIAVQFVPAAGTDLRINPQNQNVTVKFTGSSTQYQRLTETLKLGPVAIPLEAGSVNQPNQQMDLRSELEDRLLSGLGIVPDEVQPEAVSIEVRRLIDRQVPVVAVTDGFDLKGQVRIEPASITIRVPENLADEMRQSARVQLGDSLRERPGTPGEQQVRVLPIELPPALRERVSMPEEELTAEVSFTLADRNESLIKPTVPLWVLAPPTLAFDVEVENDAKTLSDVRLSGPADVLRRIADNDPELPVWGEIRLVDETSLTEGKRSLPVFFNLPEGITAEPRTVIVTLTRRNGTSPASPTP
jgi:hypothetical protein